MLVSFVQFAKDAEAVCGSVAIPVATVRFKRLLGYDVPHKSVALVRGKQKQRSNYVLHWITIVLSHNMDRTVEAVNGFPVLQSCSDKGHDLTQWE
jgi:hypothetical protein